MQKMYKRTLQMIKRLKKQPTKAEWNKIAKEKCLMNYVTVQCWENKSFSKIWKDLKQI